MSVLARLTESQKCGGDAQSADSCVRAVVAAHQFSSGTSAAVWC